MEIINSKSLNVSYEELDNKNFHWIKELFLNRLKNFYLIILSNKKISKNDSYQFFYSIASKIEFIKVTSLTIKYKEIILLQPPTYTINDENKYLILIKNSNFKDNSFGKIMSAQFICKEIINIFEVSNEYLNDLYCLLNIDDENLSEYLHHKGLSD